MSPDPLGVGSSSLSAPQSMNRYAYAVNNPLSFVDPRGLDCVYDNGDGSVSVFEGDCLSSTDNGVYVDCTGCLYSNPTAAFSIDENGDVTASYVDSNGVYQVADLGDGFTPPSDMISLNDRIMRELSEMAPAAQELVGILGVAAPASAATAATCGAAPQGCVAAGLIAVDLYHTANPELESQPANVPQDTGHQPNEPGDATSPPGASAPINGGAAPPNSYKLPTLENPQNLEQDAEGP